MWVIVFFDLPTDTKRERRASAKFRKDLLSDGFSMFQYSIYIRNCPSAENAKVHSRRVEGILPEYGKVGIICITDKQFDNMQLFIGRKNSELPQIEQQLELFWFIFRFY